jgi:hypothetical protein
VEQLFLDQRVADHVECVDHPLAVARGGGEERGDCGEGGERRMGRRWSVWAEDKLALEIEVELKRRKQKERDRGEEQGNSETFIESTLLVHKRTSLRTGLRRLAKLAFW